MPADETTAPAADVTPAERPRRGKVTWGWKRIVGAVISIAIVIGIFAYGVPRFASYGQIADVLTALTWLEIGGLVLVTIFNLITYWLANQAALPGLGIGKAAVVTQATTAVANTLPAGGAVAIGLTYAMLDSWGFSGTNVALFVGVSGIWNIFTKLGLPLLALGILAVTGHATPTYVTAAVIGVAVLAVAVTLLALVFRSEHLARVIGDGLARIVSAPRRWFGKPSIEGWGDGAAKFRTDTMGLVHRRWFRLSWTTVLSQVALFFVLLLSLRDVGISEQDISTAEVFAVYTFTRLLTAIPITPGGVGIVDLGLIGGLTFFDSSEKAALAAGVLLFRALTYVLPIPIGAAAYVVWRAKTRWRSDEGVEKQRAKKATA